MIVDFAAGRTQLHDAGRLDCIRHQLRHQEFGRCDPIGSDLPFLEHAAGEPPCPAHFGERRDKPQLMFARRTVDIVHGKPGRPFQCIIKPVRRGPGHMVRTPVLRARVLFHCQPGGQVKRYALPAARLGLSSAHAPPAGRNHCGINTLLVYL